METRLVAYDRLGSRRGVLPSALEYTIVTTHNDLSTLSVHYPVASGTFDRLQGDVEVAYEVYNGTAWIEPYNSRLILSTVDFDYLEEVPTRRYDFIHTGEVLRSITVFAAYGKELNDEGKVKFELSNPGQILKTVWDNAVSRGWSGYTLEGNASVDALGVAWPDTFTISYSFDATLDSILHGLVATGMVDYVWQGRTLRLLVPDSPSVMVDHTTNNASKVHMIGSGQSRGIDAAPEKTKHNNLATHVIVHGEANLTWIFPTGVVIPEGRREVVLSYSGVDDIGTAQILADPVILKSQNILKNTTRQFHMVRDDPSQVMPFIDYHQGHWMWVNRDNGRERMRIQSVSLTTNERGSQGFVTLGDKIDDLLEGMYKKIQALTGGVANEAGPPPVFTGRIPSAPTGVTAAADAFVDNDGITQGTITVQWAHNGKDTNNESLEMDYYVVYYRPNGSTAWAQLFETSDTVGSTSPITVYDEVLDPYVYEIMVVGVSKAGHRSDWSNIVAVTMEEDVTAPPKPTVPVVSTWLRTNTIKWDGMGFTTVNVTMPPDFDHVKVWESVNSNMTGATVVDRLAGTTLSTIVGPRTAGTTYYYALSAVDVSGNESAMTTPVSVTPTNNVDIVEIVNRIDAGVTQLTNVGSSAILSGAILESKLANNAVTIAKIADQAVSLGKLDTNANNKITQGITDAENARLLAVAADDAAGIAQDAADEAQAAADAAIASGTSLIIDGGFETDIWPVNSAVVYDTAEKRTGARSLKLTPSTGNLWPVSNWVDGSTGRTYRVVYWIKKSGTDPATSTSLGMVIQAKTTAGGTATLTTYATLAVAQSLSSTAYTKITLDYTITTADTVQVRFAPWVKQSTNVYWVDDFSATDITDAKEALAAAATAQAKADQAFADAGAAMTAAGNAQTSANGKNNVYYLAALPSGTGFTVGDTTFIRSAVGQPITAQYTWDGDSWEIQTLSHQVIASVDLGKAIVGELDGIYIKGKTIDADKLVVGRGPNLYSDEPVLDTANYNVPSYISSTGGRNGKGSIYIATIDAVQRGAYYATGNTAAAKARRTRVMPGQSYRLGAWVKTSAAAPLNTVRLIARLCRESDNAQIFTTPSSIYNDGLDGRPGVMPVDTWVWLSGIVPIPAGTDYNGLGLGFYKEAGYATGDVRFSDPSIQQTMTGELIVDGSVTATKVATNALQAKHLVVGDFENLALGSNFEDTTAIPWTLSTLHTTSTTQKKSGTRSLRLAPNAAAQTSTLIADMRTREGEQWNFKFWVYLDSTFVGTANSRIRIADQALVTLASVPYNAVTKSSWQLVEYTYTVPANVTSLVIEINSDATSGGYAYLDDIQIRRVAEASLIQNLGVEKLTVTAGANMTTAVIDKLWTDVVRSRKITTDMLIVGRGANAVYDEFFEDTAVKNFRHALSGSWGAWGRDSSAGVNLNWYGGTVTAGTSRTLYLDTVVANDKNSYIPVEQGQKWRFVFQYTSAGGGPRATVRVINRDGTTSYTATGWTKRDGTANDYEPANAAITTVERVYTVPSGVAYIMPAMQFASTCTSAYVYGGITLTNMATASLVADGAIVAPHLTVTDEMWAKVIKFKLLTGGEIDVNALNADTAWIGTLRGGILVNDAVTTTALKADAITAKHTITGATFQTEATALRGVKISSSLGLMHYDGSGNVIVRIGSGANNLVVGDLWTSRAGQAGIKLINSSVWGLPAIQYSYAGNTTAQEAASFMRYSIGGDPELVHRAPDRALVGGTGLGFVRVEGDLVLSLGSNAKQNMRVEQPLQLDVWSPVDGYHSFNSIAKLFNFVTSDGNIVLNAQNQYVQSPSTYNRTTGVGGNVYISSDGGLFRSTSALKYKILPEEIQPDERLIDVPVKDWVDAHSAEEYSRILDEPRPWTKTISDRFDAISLARIPGAIAEDVLAAGGDQYVIKGVDGAVEGLMYDRFTLARTHILANKYRTLQSNYDALLARVEALESMSTKSAS